MFDVLNRFLCIRQIRSKDGDAKSQG